MIKIGLTGGIGSGKSTVARVFSILGVPIFDSDKEAKKLYQTDKILKAEIIDAFGHQSYLENGQINRHFMIANIFSDEKKLMTLNQIVHPRVKLRFDNWIEKYESEPLIIKEAAILFESGAYKQVDKIIVVTAPDDLRIGRVIERDKITRQIVLERMSRQMKQEELIHQANYVIDNSGKISIIKQVLKIYYSLI